MKQGLNIMKKRCKSVTVRLLPFPAARECVPSLHEPIDRVTFPSQFEVFDSWPSAPFPTSRELPLQSHSLE